MARIIGRSDRWVELFNLAKRSGFVKKEAEWIANQDMDPDNEGFRRVLRNRRAHVKWLMKYLKIGRYRAMQVAAKDRLIKAKAQKVDDPWDVFVGGSP